MKTYVINLAKSIDRKVYMEQLLRPYSILNVDFVEGVDGRLMSDSERAELFDEQKALKTYGRKCKPGEIGCTLSHQKCYRYLIESNENYALILEDDITFSPQILDTFPYLEKEIDVEEPKVILLSGGFWYWKKRCLGGNYSLASIYDAYYTHAYLINKSAAYRCMNERAFFLADDWKYISSKGVKIQACLPHLINQLSEEQCKSLIFTEQENRGMVKSNMGLRRRMQMYLVGGIKKMIKLFGMYELETTK